VVAYSKRRWSRLFATTCQAVPPNQHATFFATGWRKRSGRRRTSLLKAPGDRRLSPQFDVKPAVQGCRCLFERADRHGRIVRIEQPIERSPVCSHARRRGHLRKPPVSPARGPPIDWGELVQMHDERDVFQGRIDELPAIDIRSL
jgi:hypothetical protein